MGMKTTFVAKTFMIKRKRFVPGRRRLAPIEKQVLKKARQAGRMPNTPEIKILAGNENANLDVHSTIPILHSNNAQLLVC